MTSHAFRLALMGFTLLLTQCDRISRGRAEAHYKRGYVEYNNGSLHRALEEYGRALALDPDHVEARRYRAHALLSLGEMEAARDDFEYLMALRPADLGAYAGHAHVLKQLGDLEGALADADQAAKLHPTSVLPFMMRAELKTKLADTDGAIRDANHAISLEPENADAYLARSGARQVAGDADGAMADANKALTIKESADILLQRGVIHMSLHQWSEAANDLKKAMELPREDHSYSAFLLWVSRQRLGHGKAADVELADFWDGNQSAKTPEWAIHIARFLLGRVNEGEFIAAAAADTAVKERDQTCEAWYYVGEKRLAGRDEAGAKEAFQKCVATGHKAFYEYMCARSALEKMAK